MPKKMTLFTIITICAVTLITVSSVYAVSRSKENIKSERENIVKKFSDEIELQPEKGSLEYRLKEGEKFKQTMKQLANEEAQLGLEVDENKLLKERIEDCKELYKLILRSYESDKSYLNNEISKADYEKTKKQLEFVNSLEEGFTNSNITAKDGLKKFEKVKEIK